MNYSELVEKIAGESGIAKTSVDKALRLLERNVRDELAAGGDVSIPGLGKFEAVRRAARTARNPKTGETVDVPAKRAVKFKPAKGLREAVE